MPRRFFWITSCCIRTACAPTHPIQRKLVSSVSRRAQASSGPSHLNALAPVTSACMACSPSMGKVNLLPGPRGWLRGRAPRRVQASLHRLVPIDSSWDVHLHPQRDLESPYSVYPIQFVGAVLTHGFSPTAYECRFTVHSGVHIPDDPRRARTVRRRSQRALPQSPAMAVPVRTQEDVCVSHSLIRFGNTDGYRL